MKFQVMYNVVLSPCPPPRVNSIPSALRKMKCPKRGPRLLFYTIFYCIFSVLTRGNTYDCFKTACDIYYSNLLFRHVSWGRGMLCHEVHKIINM